MFRRILSAYVRNTLIAGLFFLPIILYSDRVWTTDDTAAFVTFAWFLGWLLRSLFLAGVHTTKAAFNSNGEK